MAVYCSYIFQAAAVLALLMAALQTAHSEDHFRYPPSSLGGAAYPEWAHRSYTCVTTRASNLSFSVTGFG